MVLWSLLLSSWLSATPEGAERTPSYGSGGCGQLESGLDLPCEGANFEAHSSLSCSLGRNYLHPLVQKTVVDAYRELEKLTPGRRWQYGEMGFEKDGPLWPHKTHQNGRSADFFTPMVDSQGRPALLPTSALNKFGYSLELDRNGRLGDLVADWAAIRAHLEALERAGKPHGVQIERVILTPSFHFHVVRGSREMKRMLPRFMKKEAWVRHDEHYHVDFSIPASLMRPLTCPK